MSATPRTDGITGTFYLRCEECPQPEKCERMKSVHPDDARDLECALTAAQEKLAARRPYSDKLAQEVIAEQVKEIDRLHKLLQAERCNTRLRP